MAYRAYPNYGRKTLLDLERDRLIAGGKPQDEDFYAALFKASEDEQQQEQPKQPSASDQVASGAGNVVGSAAGYAGGQYLGGLAGGGATGTTGFGAGLGASTAGGTGGATTFGAGLGANTAGGTTSGGLLSSALPYAGPAAIALLAAYGGYRAADKYDDYKEGGLTTEEAIKATHPRGGVKLQQDIMGKDATEALGLLSGSTLLALGLDRLFGSSKDQDQVNRDRARKQLQSINFLDPNYNVALANGSLFNVGRDGGDPAYNVDFSNKQAGDVVGLIDPLVAAMTSGDPKLTSDFTGYLTNAAMSSGDVRQNVLKMYRDAGFDRNTAYNAILNLGLPQEQQDAYLASIDRLYGVQPGQTVADTIAPTPPPAPAPVMPGAPTLPQPSRPGLLGPRDPFGNPNYGYPYNFGPRPDGPRVGLLAR